MKNKFVFFCFSIFLIGFFSFFLVHKSTAQQLRFGVTYTYLYSKLLNQNIQTYNFSRPFLEKKQPLLSHGFNLSVSYLFGSSSDFSHGIGLSYSRFGSSAENEGLNSTFNQNFAKLGYILHYQKDENPFYTELHISVIGGMLGRQINDETFEFDGETARAYGVGGHIGIRTGYEFTLSDKLFLSPFIDVGYAPYFYSPNTESILNQTTELISEEQPSLFNTSFGIMLRR
ncbi:hypothetical protein WAF17_21915 [Bernardetia sp. ABR2-2B]|uniref:hypothetical protein n=1 Tax=Bernardetia sp. ABR2-2B TaxID=3127472 RepID=UPI0030D3F424